MFKSIKKITKTAFLPKLLLTLLGIAASIAGLLGCAEETFVTPKLYGKLQGNVVLYDTRQPVSNVVIRLSPTGRTAETNNEGFYSFDSVLVGKYTIQASKSGFRLEASTADIEDSRTSTIDFFLTDDQTQNRPPSKPSVVNPLTNATDVTNNITLRWKSTDPDRADSSLTYDVYFFREGQPSTLIAANLKEDSLQVKDLRFETTYYWQVVVKDRYTNVYGETWSFKTRQFPDLAYVYSKKINGLYQIFTSKDGVEEFQLTQNGSNWRPVVSPNRQEVAFISNIETDLHIYVMSVNGTRLRKVTTVPIAGLSPTDLSFCWSPDGSQLLYPSNNRLYSVRSDGTGLRIVYQAPAGRLFAGCDWTSQVNGRLVVRTTGGSIYDNQIIVYNEANADTIRTYRQSGRVGNPVFSVDGRQILFTRDARAFENPQGRMLDSRVYLMDIASNTFTDLSAGANTGTGTTVTITGTKPAGTNDLEPRFSPTGAKIILTNTNNDDSSPRSIYTIDANGSNRVLLINGAEMPYWR